MAAFYNANSTHTSGTSAANNWTWVTMTTSASTATTTYYNAVNPYCDTSTVWRQQRPFDLRAASAPLEKKQLEFDQKHAAAAKRARQLLLANLTAVQRKTFRKKGWFIVEGGKTGERYRINGSGICANVDRLAANDNQVLHKLCAHCEPGSIPTCDQLLAQKIKIEFDETEFLRLANRHAA